jgi:hypothetical protein
MRRHPLNKDFIVKKIIFVLLLLVAPLVMAAADIDVNSPAVTTIRASMHARHEQLKPLYVSGAIGLTRDGLVGMHDATVVALKDRQSVNSLIAAENDDRNALYREIANANGHPEWEAEVRNTFALRWAQKAPGGWWYQDASGAWQKK